ncbi:MAG: hypothetical protein CMF69_07740 [Magnetovibrio sp.]|nr:hypothetical protein [Magnetovibrio sp.]|tara:strand:- start:593 stop:1852 length:1260 start_codon:yes stop_codon:yes gene_type:complete
MKSVLVKIGLVFGSLLIGCFILEIIVRSFFGVLKPYGYDSEHPQEDVRYAVYDTRRFWTWKPNFRGWFDNGIDFSSNRIRTNPDGSRFVPCLNGGEARPTRIILIGDSQTFGWGLSDKGTWANQLQCALEQTNPGKFEVINLGFPGAQVDQLYQRGIGQVEPVIGKGDIIVISVTWNDLITYYVGKRFVLQALKNAGFREVKINDKSRAEVQAWETVASSYSAYEGRRPLKIRLSNPKKYLGKPSWRFSFYKKFGVFIPTFDSTMSFFSSLQYISSAFRIAWLNARVLYYWTRSKDALVKKIPANTFRSNFLLLKALDARLKRRGGKILIQLLPSRLFFDDHYYLPYSQGGKSFPTQDYLGFVSEPFCTSLNLNCVNRFEDLKTAIRDQHTFQFDGHYNEIGAAQIARGLARDVRRVGQ